MRKRILLIGAAGVALSLGLGAVAWSADAPAVVEGYKPPAKRVDPSVGVLAIRKSNATTPRLPDGRPDLTGYWSLGFPSPAGAYGRRGADTFEPDQAVMQRGSAWNKPVYKPEFWQKVEDLDFSEVTVDPEFRCMPSGNPRSGVPTKIIQNAKEIWLYYPGENLARIIQFDRKREEEDNDFDTFYGMPIAHWENDVLVIESIGFNDISWIRWQGYFHTNQMKVTERIWRQGDLLFWNATVDDPDVLAKPWTMDTYVRRLNTSSQARPEEASPCRESDADKIIDRYYRG